MEIAISISLFLSESYGSQPNDYFHRFRLERISRRSLQDSLQDSLETASSAFLSNLHSPESGLSRVIADQIRMINNQMIADYGGLLACR